MPMNARQERGRLVAQARQITRIQGGPLYFVPSHHAGGYLVDSEAGTCGCPDAQGRTPDHPEYRRCKHLYAVEIVRSGEAVPDGALETVPVVPKPVKIMRGDLTAEEQAHLRKALRFLRIRSGWDAVVKGTRFSRKTLENVAYGARPSGSLAIRLARFAGIPVDALLAGDWPPPDACPHCGRGA